MPPLRPAVAASGTGCRCRLRLCVLLVAMCVLPAAVHSSSAKGSAPPVPPRHHPFPTASPPPPPPAATATPASRDLTRPADPAGLARTHRRRSADEEMERRCYDFTTGTPEENRLRSPYFPNPYPNNTDCVRILDAGEGNVIRLEFRDMFRMEPSEQCKFDFLEARDGRYGYNEVLNRFCGDRPPSGVMSSGRYMYLHFHSDDTIEYEGFAAEYIVLPRPTQISPSPGPGPELSPCIIHVTGVEGYVNRTDIDRHCPERVNQSYLWHSPLEGMWIINVTLGWKIQMAFLTFKLDKPNDCNHNFVQLFLDNTDIPSMLNEFCGAKAETVLSDNNVMHLRYFATPQAINSTFDALFTAYREGNKKPCLEDEFDCQDDTCISRTLRCNGRINCRFLWDEEKEECKKSVSMMKEILSSDHIIIILVIFCLILSGMCFAFLYNCTRKLVRDHRIIREHVRASREARLDAAGKSTPGGSVAALRSAGAASRRPSGSGAGGGGGGGVAVPDGGGGAAAAAAASKSPRARSAPDDCYVPAAGGLLPMLLRDTPPDTQLPPPPPLNGDAVFLRDGRHRDGSSSSPRLFDDDDDDEDDGMEQDEVDLCDFMAPQPEMRDNECQTRESLFLTASVTTATSTASPTSDQTATPPPPPPPPPSAALLASRAAAAAPGAHPHSQSGSSGNEGGRAPPPLPPGPSPAASTFSTFGHHPHRHRHPGSSASPAHAPPDFATLPLHHQHQAHHHQHQQQHQPHHHHHRHHYPQPSAPPPPPAVPPAPTAEQRFRAEAVIEVENGRGRGAPPPPGADAGRPYSVQSTKSAPDVIVTH